MLLLLRCRWCGGGQPVEDDRGCQTKRGEEQHDRDNQHAADPDCQLLPEFAQIALGCEVGDDRRLGERLAILLAWPGEKPAASKPRASCKVSNGALIARWAPRVQT
jgi:hypothetical protein